MTCIMAVGPELEAVRRGGGVLEDCAAQGELPVRKVLVRAAGERFDLARDGHAVLMLAVVPAHTTPYSARNICTRHTVRSVPG